MHLVMKLSKLCNLRCNYCYEYDELANKERMPLEKLRFFLQHLAPYLEKERIEARFVLHGGEPLLLPHSYLRAFKQLQQEYLDPLGIRYKNTVQTNLVKAPDKVLDLLQELDISLGVSLDVFGDQRVDLQGRNSQKIVLDNLQRLLDRQIPVGAIAVLHQHNIDRAVDIYRFYNDLGINCRLLPIFSIESPVPRVNTLNLSRQQVLQAYQAVASAQFSSPTKIKVYPLCQYFQAAVRDLTQQAIKRYEPAQREWALIINTNGDVYNHGDAYLPEGLMGNVFKQSIQQIFASSAYARVNALRHQRSQTCRHCSFDRKCHQIPVVEALPSERLYDEKGHLLCSIAQPMIQYMRDHLQDSSVRHLLEAYAESQSQLSVAL